MRSLKLFQKYFLNQQPVDGPIKQDDFDMHLEPVSLEDYKNTLLAYSFDNKVLATIDYQNKQYEISQLDIPGSEPTKRLLIFAGVHGNEFAAALSVIDILEDIKRSPTTYANWHIRIVTPLNPVGFVHQSRYNEIGRDINRDFKDFLTVGGRLQKEAIEQFRPDAIISFHEGPQDGFFVIAEGNVSRVWRKQITDALRAEGIALARKSFFGVSIGEGFWQKKGFIYLLQRLFGIYTLGRYAYEHDITLLTTESSWKSQDVAQRRNAHLMTVRALVDTHTGSVDYTLENVTLADAIIETMPFADKLIEWCHKYPDFKEGLKITNPANFIALGAVLTSYTKNKPDDEVIGFISYDMDKKYFKQDFIVNVSGDYAKFILYSKVPSKKYGPYVQHIKQFFAVYGKNGDYAGTHHMTLEELDSKAPTLSERARQAMALAERIQKNGRRQLTPAELLDMIRKIRAAKKLDG